MLRINGLQHNWQIWRIFRVLRYNVGGYGILAVVKTYLLAAWVWQDAIPSYISFKTHN